MESTQAVETAIDTVEKVETSVGFFGGMAQFMEDGGIAMWVILFAWIGALVLSVYKYLKLQKSDVDGSSLMGQVKNFVLNNQVEKAIQVCQKSNTHLGDVLKEGLKRTNQSRQQIQDIIEASIISVNSKVARGLGAIALVANISTLMGLLGTIYGLIQSFAAVASADPSEKALLLAQGIAKAMNTTAFGLISAITLLVIHSYLTSKADKIVTDVDEYSMRLIDLVGTRKNKEYQDAEKAA